MKRFLSLLIAVVMVMTLLPVVSFATEFDTENFKGLVLTTTVDNVTVQLYKGYSTEAADLMTPVYVDGRDQYYEVAAEQHYYCVSQPASTTRYTLHQTIYITSTEANKKTVLDMTPGVRTTSGWDARDEVCRFTDEVMTKAFPSNASLWPQYADIFTTPAFGAGRNDHRQTTQTEMNAFLTGLDDAGDNMYIYSAGKTVMGSFDVPVVIFTTVDLSDAKTLEQAAAKIREDGEKNNKPTVQYQAEIHGNEPAAGEAALGMIKLLDGTYGNEVLDKLNVYVIPRLNPYGAYMSKRVTWINSSTYLDPNRDFMLLQTSEVQLRMKVFNLLDPDVVFDNHEYQFSLLSTAVTKRDMMICSHHLPTNSQGYKDMAIDLAYAAFDQLGKDKLSYSWYSSDAKNYSISSVSAGVGSGNTAMRGTFHILMETLGSNFGLNGYERRVASHASAVTGLLNYIHDNAAAVKSAVKAERETIVENGKTYSEDDTLILGTAANYHPEYNIEGKKVNLRNGGEVAFTFEAKMADTVTRSRIAPTAYVIPAGESYTQKVLDLMDMQGIAYQFIPGGANVMLQQYLGTIEDGTVGTITLTEEQLVNFPNGAYVFTMNQVDAMILACYMEPDTGVSSDTLAKQGIITPTNGKYPIYRYIRDLNEEGFIDLAEDETTPTELVAVDAVVAGGTGKITGLDASKAYEYKAAEDENYTPVAAGATEIAGLQVGEYLVRYPADGETPAGTAASITLRYALSDYAVYLDSANGSNDNDGYTGETAVATIQQAQAQLDKLMAHAPAETTGVIRIQGTYEIATTTRSYKLPAHSYPLLITGGTLKFTNTNSNSQKWMGIGGPTTFDDISIQLGAAGSYQYISGEGHKLVIGEHVTSLPYETTYFGIQGGAGVYNSATVVAQTDVTVRSGYWWSIYGGGYTSGVTGDVRLVVSGANVSRVTANHNGNIGGNVYMEVENTTVRTEIVAGSTQAGKNVGGDVTLVLKQGVTGAKDGIFVAGDTGNTAGKVTVIADGIDLTANAIYGSGNGTGTFGSLELVLKSGQLADMADTFLTQDGIFVKIACPQTKMVKLPYDIKLELAADMALDLNGHDLLSLTQESGKLTLKDSATDDYDVADGIYGTVPAGNYQAEAGYMTITENGKTSFHKYEMALTELVFNPTRQGISYKTGFRGDQVIKSQVAEFGIAMRAYKAPDATSIGDDTDCRTHVALTKEKWQTGNTDASVKSVYIANIVIPALGAEANQNRAQVEIYGCSYIRLQDGRMLLSAAEAFSMQSAVEQIDEHFHSSYLTDANRTALVEMYNFATYNAFMKNWNIPNIKAAAK